LSGIIDVLTDKKIIEIKVAYNWKHAIGQIQCYGCDYEDREKWIYLFDSENEDDNFSDSVKYYCKKLCINVRFL